MESTTTNLEGIVYHYPILLNLAKYLKIKDIKTLSQTSKSLLDLTTVIVNQKCNLSVTKQNEKTLRPYKSVVTFYDAWHTHQFSDSKSIQYMKMQYCTITPERINGYVNLESLDLLKTEIRRGAYTNIRNLKISGMCSCTSLGYYECEHSLFRDDLVFNNLQSCDIEDHIDDFYYSTKDNVDMLDKFFQNHSTLVFVRIKSRMLTPINAEPILKSLENWTKITALHLDTPFNENLKSDQFLHAINKLTHLTYLKLEGYNIDNLQILNLANLHTFEFNGQCSMSGKTMNKWLPTSSTMQSFTIGELAIDTISLQTIAERFPNLIVLGLLGQASFKWHPISSFASIVDCGVFPYLKVLSWCNGSTSGQIHNIIAPNITELNISSELTENDVNHIVKKFPLLSKIRYAGVSRVKYFLSKKFISQPASDFILAINQKATFFFKEGDLFEYLHSMAYGIGYMLTRTSTHGNYHVIKRRKAVRKIKQSTIGKKRASPVDPRMSPDHLRRSRRFKNIIDYCEL